MQFFDPHDGSLTSRLRRRPYAWSSCPRLPISASGKAKSKTVDHIHRVIPKSLPVLCKMATADNSDITVNDPSDNLAGYRLSW